MSSQCSICLSSFEDPVCIPCGHVYCSICLGDYINSSTEDGYSASCPTCRAIFPIVSPELTCLPKAFHRFVTPSIRRVYLDTTAVQKLESQLDGARKQIERLRQESERLMLQCEKYMHESKVHAEGEAEASVEAERLHRLLRQEQRKARLAEEEADKWRERYTNVKEELDESRQQQQRQQQQLNQSSGRIVSLASKRSVERLFSDDGEQENMSTSSTITPRRRVIRSLPQNRPKKKLRPATPHESNSAYSGQHVPRILTSLKFAKTTRT